MEQVKEVRIDSGREEELCSVASGVLGGGGGNKYMWRQCGVCSQLERRCTMNKPSMLKKDAHFFLGIIKFVNKIVVGEHIN